MLSQLRRLMCVALAAGALALPVRPAAAQDSRGSIVGTATDASGGVLPGVSVTITNTATGVSQEVVTDERGAYRAFYLNPGAYSVTAELQGFKKIARRDNPVRVGE